MLTFGQLLSNGKLALKKKKKSRKHDLLEFLLLYRLEKLETIDLVEPMAVLRLYAVPKSRKILSVNLIVNYKLSLKKSNCTQVLQSPLSFRTIPTTSKIDEPSSIGVFGRSLIKQIHPIILRYRMNYRGYFNLTVYTNIILFSVTLATPN